MLPPFVLMLAGLAIALFADRKVGWNFEKDITNWVQGVWWVIRIAALASLFMPGFTRTFGITAADGALKYTLLPGLVAVVAYVTLSKFLTRR